MARRVVPEVSLGLGLATATIVYAIHQKSAPTNVDVMAGPQGDDKLDRARQQATWVAAGTVAGISLLAKDPTIFIIGGAAVIVLDWLTRINNWTNPATGSVFDNPYGVVAAPNREAPVNPGQPDKASAQMFAVR